MFLIFIQHMTKLVKEIEQLSIHPKAKYILGVDINRKGKDETAFVIVEVPAFSNPATDKLRIALIETRSTADLTQVIGYTQYLNSIFNFEKIYVDSTGIGAGVVDSLKQYIGKGKVEEIIFTVKSKPEMFYNLKLLLQQRRLKLSDYRVNEHPNAKKLFYQLLSIQQEFRENSDVPLIFHQKDTHDDIVCALALACLYFKPGKGIKHGYYLS